ncbi:TraM recognition domain-containing protein [Lactococcus insecticola]|uniref:TraD/TraG TraM recognition site domain-containing protein n=1 Tax=Pseudolactococcus insecticola TaxID=2709158 RepID=A0A6A0B9I0_9LACT|nr:TraM recognition domain-containing protein [Lactococcus insecticola]GFH41273.1 hypothetical protein Hs20B_16710 [Lactococcus insecticola]
MAFFNKDKSNSKDNPLRVDPLSGNGVMDLLEQRRLKESHEDDLYDFYDNQQLVRGSRDVVQEKSLFLPVVLSVTAFLVFMILIGIINSILRMIHAVNPETGQVMQFNLIRRLLFSFLVAITTFGIAYAYFNKTNATKNILNRNDDINDYKNDMHVMLPREIIRDYKFVPDANVEFTGHVTAIVAHFMVKNDLKSPVKVTVNVPARNKQGNVILVDEEGNQRVSNSVTGFDDRSFNEKPLFQNKTLPMFDEDLGNDLFNVALVADSQRNYYQIDDFEISKKDMPLRQLIKDDWKMPTYEHGRPAGVYASISEPGHVLMISASRSGKDVTLNNPFIDILMREKSKPNIIINDTKMEALVEHAKMAEVRGYEPIQFNLMIPENTDGYNTFGPAIESTRTGRYEEVAKRTEVVGKSLFSANGSSDPFWTDASNNIFKRQKLEMLSYYMNEENLIVYKGRKNNWSEEFVSSKIDELWGFDIPSNLYYAISDLVSKFTDDPSLTFLTDNVPENGKVDLMTILFDGMIDVLPENVLTTFALNAHNALAPMMASEKTRASVYGVSLTGLSFFVDPVVMRLTSVKPSQSLDLESLSFPRMVSIKFSFSAFETYDLIGDLVVWHAYRDSEFTDMYPDSLFGYEGIVDGNAWASYYIRGKFESSTIYIRASVKDLASEKRYEKFSIDFKLTLEYKKDLSGENYVIKNGRMFYHGGVLEVISKKTYTTYAKRLIREDNGNLKPVMEEKEVYYIDKTKVRYTTRPKQIYLITPPHMMIYQKQIITILTQLIDAQLEPSYVVDKDQKPFTSTYYFFNEYGNLQADGKGIEKMPTYVTAALAQEQFFIFAIQALQQIKKMHTDDVWQILQSNANVTMFMKSSDKALISQLSEASGTKHESHVNSKSLTMDTKKMIPSDKSDGKIQYTKTTSERPVLEKNDFLNLSQGRLGNTISLIAGSSPIVARNELMFPAYFRLNRDRNIELPKLSGALIRTKEGTVNLSRYRLDTDAYFRKRIAQYKIAPYATVYYNEQNAYSIDYIKTLNSAFYSQEVMLQINLFIDLENDLKEEIKSFESKLKSYNGVLEEFNGFVDIDKIEERHINYYYYIQGLFAVSFEEYKDTKKGERFVKIHENKKIETLALYINFLKLFKAFYSQEFKDVLLDEIKNYDNKSEIISAAISLCVDKTSDESTESNKQKYANALALLSLDSSDVVESIEDPFKIAYNLFVDEINKVSLESDELEFYPVSLIRKMSSVISDFLFIGVVEGAVKGLSEETLITYKKQYGIRVKNSHIDVEKGMKDISDKDISKVSHSTLTEFEEDHEVDFEVNDQILNEAMNSTIEQVLLFQDVYNTNIVENFVTGSVMDSDLVSVLSLAYLTMLEENNYSLDSDFIMDSDGNLSFNDDAVSKQILSAAHLNWFKNEKDVVQPIAGETLIARQINEKDEIINTQDVAKNTKAFVYDGVSKESVDADNDGLQDYTSEMDDDANNMDVFRFTGLFLTIISDPDSKYFIKNIFEGRLFKKFVEMYNARDNSDDDFTDNLYD